MDSDSPAVACTADRVNRVSNAFVNPAGTFTAKRDCRTRSDGDLVTHAIAVREPSDHCRVPDGEGGIHRT